jgi:hypothetical protein
MIHNFIEYSIKNVKYYKSLYNLIFLYTNELKEIITDKFMINYINEEISDEIVKKLIKKIEKYNSSSGQETLNLLRLVKNIIKLETLLKFHINIINEIDIYDKKILMSDTSKNNINKNKLHILDIYKIHYTNINKNNILITQEIVQFICNHIITITTDKQLLEINIINTYFQKHLELIDFYILFIGDLKLITIDNIVLNDYIDTLIDQNKSILLEKELEKLDIKCNKNINVNLSSQNDTKKSTKPSKSVNTITSIKNNLNIVKTFNNFKLQKQFESIESILDHHNISYQSKNFTGKDLKSKLENINKALTNNKVIFILIECKKDLISYNIQNLLNNNIKVDKLSGINDNYLKKTNTIMETSQNDENNNVYISNIQKIHILNSSFNIKSSKLNVDYNDYNSKIILVHTNDSKSFNLMSNDAGAPITFKDIVPLIKNQPSYNIENYNSMLENNILSFIENKSILDEYHKTMQFDIKSYNLQNTLQMKNNIMDDIYKKIKIEFTFDNKNIIVDMILNIIIDNISTYIKDKNKIEYDAETYMTYLFSVHSLMNKFKKDIIDNYDNGILDKLEYLIDNIYGKILKINDNVVDKYYYTHIIDN